jgi:hypothetical protein
LIYPNLKAKNMKQKKLKLMAFLFGIGMFVLHAQETVPVSGGNATGTGGTASYTVGQIVNNTNTGTTGTSAQGVQQPYEISVVTGIDDAVDIMLEMVVYPNPATDYLKLKLGDNEIVNLRYQLYDINGSLLLNAKIEVQETDISMQTLKPSTYFLKVLQGNKEIKTFKIIKK